MFTSTPDPARELTDARSAEDLQRAYIWSINSAIESGGDVLADELADGFSRESDELSQGRLARSAA